MSAMPSAAREQVTVSLDGKQTVKYDNETIKEYEASLTLNQWRDLKQLRKIERDFAKNAGWDYDRYWETMTLKELREAQS